MWTQGDLNQKKTCIQLTVHPVAWWRVKTLILYVACDSVARLVGADVAGLMVHSLDVAEGDACIEDVEQRDF